MAVTDLLSRIPIPPARQPDPTDGAGGVALGEWDAFSAPAEFRPPTDGRAAGPAALAPMPSWAVLALGGFVLSLIGLLALILLRPFDAAPVALESSALGPAARVVTVPVADPAAAAPAAAETTGTAGTSFGADPTPVPAEAIARLEAASNEPLHGELTQLLNAIQVGFGTRSAQIDPALRPYTVRMASRFEWNPDTFRIAVTASSAELAAARAATLTRIFAAAVAAQRLQIEPTTGPDALTLAPR